MPIVTNKKVEKKFFLIKFKLLLHIHAIFSTSIP